MTRLAKTLPPAEAIPFVNRTAREDGYVERRSAHLRGNPRYRDGEYADAPFLYCARQALTGSLFRIKLYEHVLQVHGAIVECGVHRGNNFMLFNQLVSIHEPHNLSRQVIGFDTFQGFRSLDARDVGAQDGHFSDSHLGDIREALALHDANRPVGHVPRGELVVGDATKTIPRYVAENPHLMIALLYLDFDIYEPTKVALEQLVPLMPKGGVIAFDELAIRHWPGETLALKEVLRLNDLTIRRMPFEAYASYAIIGE